MKDWLGEVTNAGKYLEGLSFPADKEEIVSTLEENNAPDSVISAAEKVPDKLYSSVTDFVTEMKDKIPFF